MTGHWAASEGYVLVRLLAKPTGGYRPIALYPTIFRVMGRARAEAVRKWFASLTEAIPEINMAPRRQVSDATYRTMMRQNLARCKHQSGQGKEPQVCEVQWDLSKAFDRVDWQVAEAAAKQFGYDQAAWRLSKQSYMWGRRLKMEGLVGPTLLPSRGIAAGSPFAAYELALVLLPGIMQHRMRKNLQINISIQLRLSVHVDDTMLTIEGFEAGTVVAAMHDEGTKILGFIDSIGMVTEPKKGFVLASTQGLAKAATKLFGQEFGALSREVKIGRAHV